MASSLKISGVSTDTEAEKDCDACEDTIDDSGIKITVQVDGRKAEFYLCEDCLTNEVDIVERAATK